ncbi:MAG: GNAT family N-acetyltransferase [Parvibaculaceae bacterium]
MMKQSLPKTGVEIAALKSRPELAPVFASWVYFEWSLPMRRNWADTCARYDPADDPDKLPATFFAAIQGAPAGLASLRVSDSYDFLPGATPWICNVYVHEKARGLGLAGSLCRHLCGHARRLGFDEVFLATAVGENSLYHRLGFTEVSRVDYFGPKHVLRRHLADWAQD